MPELDVTIHDVQPASEVKAPAQTMSQAHFVKKERGAWKANGMSFVFLVQGSNGSDTVFVSEQHNIPHNNMYLVFSGLMMTTFLVRSLTATTACKTPCFNFFLS